MKLKSNRLVLKTARQCSGIHQFNSWKRLRDHIVRCMLRPALFEKMARDVAGIRNVSSTFHCGVCGGVGFLSCSEGCSCCSDRLLPSKVFSRLCRGASIMIRSLRLWCGSLDSTIKFDLWVDSVPTDTSCWNTPGFCRWLMLHGILMDKILLHEDHNSNFFFSFEFITGLMQIKCCHQSTFDNVTTIKCELQPQRALKFAIINKPLKVLT